MGDDGLLKITSAPKSLILISYLNLYKAQIITKFPLKGVLKVKGGPGLEASKINFDRVFAFV